MGCESVVHTQSISQDRVFSSDISADSTKVIFSTELETLKTLGKNNLEVVSESDSFRADLKFYPDGHELATSVDTTYGIKLWDVVAKRNIYTYSTKDLHTHSFSPKGILCAASEYSLKFFYLKVRYSINSTGLLDAKILEWKDENVFYAVNDLGIHEFDIRNLGAANRIEVSGISDFKVVGKLCFFITKEKRQYYLTKMSDGLAKKKCSGAKMAKIRDDLFCLGVLGSNSIEVFTQEDAYKVSFSDIGTIKMMHHNRAKNGSFLFTEKGIYRFYYLFR